jgi:hypothetical protein
MTNVGLGEEYGRANVDVKHGLQVGECHIRGHPGGSNAGTVDKNIKPSKGVHGLAHSAADGVRVGAVGQNGKSTPAFFLACTTVAALPAER